MTRMHARKMRLIWLGITAVLFAGWIGWLAFLVANRPIVLARTPFLVADVDVVARLDRLDGPATIQEVAWARDPRAQELVGEAVPVRNLERCRQDWHGPGEYILPLLKTGDTTFEVANPTGYPEGEQKQALAEGHTPPSRSPGYDARSDRPPHIYPLTSQTRAQLEQILH